MNLKEVFDQLTFGELSQLSIGGNETGAIQTKNYDRMVAHTNLGLTALYKRFNLKEGRLTVELVPGRFTYPINSDYAEANDASTQAVKYIKDADSPFADDIHKIERVYGQTGYEFALNDEADPYSMFTPSAKVLRVPEIVVTGSIDMPDEIKTTELEIVYRANHPKIIPDGIYLDPEEIYLELPDSHLEALLLFMAGRIHTPTGMSNEANMGNTYSAKYEQECMRLEQLNLRVDQFSQPDRIGRNGWV
jgi:hypothetical protein